MLTGPEIGRQIELGSIEIDPYEPDFIGPNSMDLRLHSCMAVYRHGLEVHSLYNDVYQGKGLIDSLDGVSRLATMGRPMDLKQEDLTCELLIPDRGLILWPGVLYLARTVESVFSSVFCSEVTGRSSIGRKGMCVHVTAGLIDQGFRGTVTLELSVIHPLVVYPWFPVCQISFMEVRGEPQLYEGRYQGQVDATASRSHL